jgi:hypothetical protein
MLIEIKVKKETACQGLEKGKNALNEISVAKTEEEMSEKMFSSW